MKVYVLTGAGISAESGISTFRDSNGLWENHKITEVCNFDYWEKNKELVFEFYNQRRIQLKDVKPNKIHKELALLQKENPNVEFIFVTQNIDNLLERAGCKNVIHVHGELTKLMCLECDHKWDIGYKSIETSVTCPKCNSGKVKPFIVFFKEPAPNYKKMYELLDNLTYKDIFLVMGTEGVVLDINNMVKISNAGLYILNNLNKNKYINDYKFDKVYYKKGTEAISEIKKNIGYWAWANGL
jgi:NAD-dependent deacetylase